MTHVKDELILVSVAGHIGVIVQVFETVEIAGSVVTVDSRVLHIAGGAVAQGLIFHFDDKSQVLCDEYTVIREGFRIHIEGFTKRVHTVH